MITTIAIAAASGMAGLAIGTTVFNGGTRRRLSNLEAEVDNALPQLVTKAEIAEAFREIAVTEQQREAAIAFQFQQLRQQVAQLAPALRTDAVNGTFQQENAAARAAAQAPTPAEINAMLNQQLSALNERLQQVTSQRMPA